MSHDKKFGTCLPSTSTNIDIGLGLPGVGSIPQSFPHPRVYKQTHWRRLTMEQSHSSLSSMRNLEPDGSMSSGSMKNDYPLKDKEEKSHNVHKTVLVNPAFLKIWKEQIISQRQKPDFVCEEVASNQTSKEDVRTISVPTESEKTLRKANGDYFVSKFQIVKKLPSRGHSKRILHSDDHRNMSINQKNCDSKNLKVSSSALIESMNASGKLTHKRPGDTGSLGFDGALGNIQRGRMESVGISGVRDTRKYAECQGMSTRTNQIVPVPKVEKLCRKDPGALSGLMHLTDSHQSLGKSPLATKYKLIRMTESTNSLQLFPPKTVLSSLVVSTSTPKQANNYALPARCNESPIKRCRILQGLNSSVLTKSRFKLVRRRKLSGTHRLPSKGVNALQTKMQMDGKKYLLATPQRTSCVTDRVKIVKNKFKLICKTRTPPLLRVSKSGVQVNVKQQSMITTPCRSIMKPSPVIHAATLIKSKYKLVRKVRDSPLQSGSHMLSNLSHHKKRFSTPGSKRKFSHSTRSTHGSLPRTCTRFHLTRLKVIPTQSNCWQRNSSNHLCEISGKKYLVKNSGKTLKRLSESQLSGVKRRFSWKNTSISNVSGTARQELLQLKASQLLKKKSLTTLRERGALKRKPCLFFLRFGRCHKERMGTCPFQHSTRGSEQALKFWPQTRSKKASRVMKGKENHKRYYMNGLKAQEQDVEHNSTETRDDSLDDDAVTQLPRPPIGDLPSFISIPSSPFL